MFSIHRKYTVMIGWEKMTILKFPQSTGFFSSRFFPVLERFMKQARQKNCISRMTGYQMRSESKCDYITRNIFFFSIPYFVPFTMANRLGYLFDSRTFSCEA